MPFRSKPACRKNPQKRVLLIAKHASPSKCSICCRGKRYGHVGRNRTTQTIRRAASKNPKRTARGFKDLLNGINADFLRSRPIRSNFTTPSTRANRVSSLPIPTLVPGWIWVPRCRTRMLPAKTFWPSARFAPKRLDSESRPFLVEPTPFYEQRIEY